MRGASRNVLCNYWKYAHGRTVHEQDEYPQAVYLQHMPCAAQAVSAGEIAAQCEDQNLIAGRVRNARVKAVENAMQHKAALRGLIVKFCIALE